MASNIPSANPRHFEEEDAFLHVDKELLFDRFECCSSPGVVSSSSEDEGDAEDSEIEDLRQTLENSYCQPWHFDPNRQDRVQTATTVKKRKQPGALFAPVLSTVNATVTKEESLYTSLLHEIYSVTPIDASAVTTHPPPKRRRVCSFFQPNIDVSSKRGHRGEDSQTVNDLVGWKR